MADEPATTQRAYTLRLTGADPQPDQSPQEAIRVASVLDRKDVKRRKQTPGNEATEPPAREARDKEPAWNGTLLADRERLKAIGKLIEASKHAEAEKATKSLHWWLIVSLSLEPRGPWLPFADAQQLLEIRHNRTLKAKAVVVAPHDRRHEWRGLAFPMWHPRNGKGRHGMAKHILSCLHPGLRVLSVDLGHRYAAACAVWETLSTPQVHAACHAAAQPPPPEDSLYVHLRNGKGATIYRRIGADTLPNGEPHPAPWARLDRQFLIRLQGEDREARKASPAERQAVEALERSVGCEPPAKRPTQAHELMSEAVRTARLALQRRGRRARIAFNLTATKKLLPGGQEEALTNETRVPLLADALADWYALFTGRGWTDPWAEGQWKKHIEPLLPEAGLPHAPLETEATPKGMKKYRGDLIEALKPAAEALVANDSLTRELHTLWATRCQADDALWRKRLRWLTDWILPRGAKAKASGATRHVGGLSLTRIANIKSLYQLHKAFRMRPEPEDLRKNIPKKGDDELRDFALGMLRTMERLREQRVKQLASRIAEAALGLGRMKAPSGPKQPNRPQARVDPPCHAVVIENLTDYRPEQTRTRRENRQLMSWSSSKVKKFLAEACQLHGLHLREVQAKYTSRQDSRTGAPGLRCQDVSVNEFMQSPFWQKQVAQAKKKADDKRDARERFLCDPDDSWRQRADQWGSAPALRIPLRSGEIFVSADPRSPAAKGIQADLNAAANIGLRALADPDWPGRWWYVPMVLDGEGWRIPNPKICGGALCLDKLRLAADRHGVYSTRGTPLSLGDDEAVTRANGAVAERTAPPDSAKKQIKAAKKALRDAKKAAAAKPCINLWREPSAHLPQDGWQDTTAYWNAVQARVIAVLPKPERSEHGPVPS